MLLDNHLRNHIGRASFLGSFATGICLLAMLVTAAPLHARAQDDTAAPEKHGRKYKAPPETAHIEVQVLKGFNKKPIMNAAVVFHSIKDGRTEGNMEMKTDPDGKAIIDVIPTGSKLTIQIIADGFATFAEDYVIDTANRQILIEMQRPKAQVSAYVDNSGKASERQPGVQEPIRPKAKPAAPVAPVAPTTPTTPAASTPGTPNP